MAVKLVKPINYKNIEKITDADFEKQLKLLGVNSKFIVALSGGPDSLALLYLAKNFAKKNNLKFTAVSIDHNLREDSSKEIEWITAGDLSGVTLNFDTETLFFIENRYNTIWEADTDMNLIRTINGKDFGDSEDIVYLGNQEFGIINEEGYLFLGNIPLNENDI